MRFAKAGYGDAATRLSASCVKETDVVELFYAVCGHTVANMLRPFCGRRVIVKH